MRKDSEQAERENDKKEDKTDEWDRKLLVSTLGKGQYFGEIAAMTGHKHTATIRVKRDTNMATTEQCLIVAAMPNEVFKRLEEEVPSCFLTFKQ